MKVANYQKGFIGKKWVCDECYEIYDFKRSRCSRCGGDCYEVKGKCCNCHILIFNLEPTLYVYEGKPYCWRCYDAVKPPERDYTKKHTKVCAWCNEELEPGDSGHVSHGMCAACEIHHFGIESRIAS